MRISKRGLDFIKGFEGFVPYVYDDLRAPVNGKYREWNGGAVRGTLTIGYGHTNAAKHPLKIKKGLRVTEKEALNILDVDLDECEDAVNDMVKVPLTQGQFDALVSFTYNCGPGNLRKLIAPLNRGDYDRTRAKFDLYVKSKGVTLRGLKRRRDGEQALWDDDYPYVPTEPHGVDHPAEVDTAEPDKLSPEAKKEVVNGSRRLTFQERVTNFLEWLGLGGIGSFALLEQVRSFLTDWKGLALLGIGIAVWLAFKYSKYLSLREVAEGRYVPSGEAK